MLPLLISDEPTLFLWREEPSFAAPADVLVPGVPTPPPGAEPPAVEPASPAPPAGPVNAAIAPSPAVPASPSLSVDPVILPPATIPAPPPEPAAQLPSPDPVPAIAASLAPEPPPAFDLPPEDAFPTPAELDAIRDANAGDPPGPSLDERAAVIALLGLDPAIAEDPVLYAETLAHLTEPDPEQVLAQWMHDYGVAAVDPADGLHDWQVG